MAVDRVWVKYPLASRVITYIILPILLSCFGVYLYLADGLAVADIQSTSGANPTRLSIIRDDTGVPTITSTDDLQVYYGLGRAHAQDRLWQMEIARRRAAGRLSELTGPDALASDTLMRTLALSQQAQKSYQRLGQFEKARLDAYVKGVNATIDNLKLLPLEYLALDVTAEPWKAEDSLLVMLDLSWQMSANMADELHRSLLIQALGQDKTAQLTPPLSTSQAAVTRLSYGAPAAQQATPPSRLGPGFGSHAVVIGPQHSASGLPLLANNLQWHAAIPSKWYMVKLQGDKLQAKGATLPGLPFVLSGSNNQIAWGLATTMADSQDLYLAKVNPLDRNQYEVDGVFRDMSLTTTSISFKEELLAFNPPKTLTLRRTEHGPVISDSNSQLSDFVYSLRWSGDNDFGASFSSFIKLNHAQDWAAFNAALTDYVAPLYRFVYADKHGNIGALSPGYYPSRGESQGQLPTLGWLSQNHWQDATTNNAANNAANNSAANTVYNPPSGVIVTSAGHSPLGQNIRQLMAQGGAIKGEDLSALIHAPGTQLLTDAQTYLAKLSANDTATAEQQDRWLQVTELVSQWDGKLSADSQGATVFMTWLFEFYQSAVADDLTPLLSIPGGNATFRQWLSQPDLSFVEQLLQGKYPHWCHPLDCQQLAVTALQTTIAKLNDELGDDIEDWHWSAIYQAQLTHRSFDTKGSVSDNLWRLLFKRRLDETCHNVSVSDTLVGFHKQVQFVARTSAGYQQVLSLDDKAADIMVINTGQSGDPLNPHYDDLTGLHCYNNRYNTKHNTKHKTSLELASQSADTATTTH
jgi:penicillin amidase